MTDYARLLDRTAEIASAYLGSLDARPVGRPVDLAALRSAMGGRVARRSVGSGTGRRGPGSHRRSGLGRVGRAALLRLRGRRRRARLPGSRLAGLRLGSERRDVRHVAGRRGGRGSGGGLAGRAPRPAGRDERRVRDRRHDGQLHGARGGTPRGAGAGRLGCRAARPAGRAAGHRRDPRRDPRHGLRVAPDARAWAARAIASAGSPPTTRAGCAPTPCARSWPGSTARRSCAPRPAT